MKSINVILFDNFTTLDALGPAEVLSKLSGLYELHFFSLNGGLVTSSTATQIHTEKLDCLGQTDVLLVPGGWGTRELVNNEVFIEKLKQLASGSDRVLCVCTGSVLLARTGLLNGRNATSNKLSWNWVIAQNENVHWVKKARWVVDGKYYTSSGITAGIDMALGFVSDTVGPDAARKIASALEYSWNGDRDDDPFADA
jgi:Transcriptional regulator containing an amidase domain and an AraC-type DNA-binding HTH domain